MGQAGVAEKKPVRRPYVGIVKGTGGGDRRVFRSLKREDWPNEYSVVIGPFRTTAGAEVYANGGATSIREADRKAKERRNP